MDLDLVKSEILQDVFREGMAVPTPASERQGPAEHVPGTWPEHILAHARQAEAATTVKSSWPKFFNPLLRKQNLVNRSLIASARAGADGVAEVMKAAERLEEEVEVLRRAALVNESAEGWQSLRGAAKAGPRMVEFPWVMRQTAQLPAGATILVCGCAASLHNLELASLGFTVIGVDRRACADTHPRFSFLEGDFAAPPLAEASVDVVIAVSCLGSAGPGILADGQPSPADLAAMQQWHRVTKPGGAIIFTVPFGQPTPTSTRQIYNSAGLDVLLKGRKVEQREFAVCSPRQAWLSPVPEAEAAAGAVNSAGRPQALALMVVRG